MVGKTPTHGTKVDLGENAPIVREGAGLVASDSLAAESVQAGGEFAENRNIRTEEVGTKESTGAHSSSSGGSGGSGGGGGGHQKSSSSSSAGKSHYVGSGGDVVGDRGRIPSSEQGHAAPTYVNSQFIRDTAGPHGKNITEDPEMTGRRGKFNVKVGSREDPSREAERTMLLKQTRGAPGTGERQVGERGTDEQPFKALGRDASA
ncbi:hypothetical protein BD289DRAFT_65816 [Coniella lustricola]|uniref:Uncharacterized protein n=1 Tax=Coniella lustricola TaxID=2025994 RepID=A0A2T3AHY9_9PEZI|nr:hypothetical protein BD289DRAFT_65816 [Coniella lustricola]